MRPPYVNRVLCSGLARSLSRHLSIVVLVTGAVLVALLWADSRLDRRRFAAGRSALIQAVRANDLERVRRHLQEGADIGASGPGAESAVHAALQPHRTDAASQAIAALIVERMATRGVPKHGVSMRFALAVRSRRTDLLRKLLARAPDADLTDAPMNTALELAIAGDQPRMVSALVDRLGPDRAGRLCAPDGPVLDACRYGSADSLRVLLDRFGPAAAGRRSLDHRQPGATGLMLALQAVPRRILPTMRALLQSGADPNVGDADGSTPLHLAARLVPTPPSGSHDAPNGVADAPSGGLPLQAMHLLLAHGANPNIADRDRMTPLMIAKQHKRPDCVRLLLAHGAAQTTPDRSGRAAPKPPRRPK